MVDNLFEKIEKALARHALLLLLVFIPALSALMHQRVFSLDLMSIHVWRQTQTQSTIVNFYEEDFNILHPRRNDRGSGDGIFRMEFPLMQWLYAGVHKALNNNDITITRILCFLTGIFSAWGIFLFIRLLFGAVLPALLGAWAFTFSPAFYYYTLNPMPDNFALCCGIWGLVAYAQWRGQKPGWVYWALSMFMLSLATLSKLPFVLFFAAPLLDASIQAWATRDGWAWAMRCAIAALSLSMPFWWYATVVPSWQGNGIVQGIFGATQSPWKLFDYFQHNLISTLPELLLNFAALPFFVFGLFQLFKHKSLRDKSLWPFAASGILLCSYFLFEINMITKIHDYYLFPFLPFLFVVVAYGMLQWLQHGKGWLKGLAFLLLLLMPFFAWLRMEGRWDPSFPHFNVDLLRYRQDLRQAAPKDALCVVGDDESHFIYFYHLDKKGWGFHHSQLSADRLKLVISEGARFLYSDNRAVDTSAQVRPFLDSLVLERGSFKVWRLVE